MHLTITDVRAAGHCVKGARSWFAAQGLNFRDFVRNGIESDLLVPLDDAIVNQVIARKLAREQRDGG